jgi:glycine/D-amino acid oxidase-like deaminating enzyme
MDLRSGLPLWLCESGWFRVYPALEDDVQCDIVVLGGGITGALLADRLSREGVSVVVLEKRDIGQGSTAATTSLLQYETDAEMLTLAERYGDEVATRVYRLGLWAIDELERDAADVKIDCRFARRPSLYLASRDRDVDRLLRECAYRRAQGFDVAWWSGEEVARRMTFAAAGAIVSRGDAEIDAYRLTHALLGRAMQRGARVFDRSEAEEIQSVNGQIVAATASGRVTATRIAYATGYESGRYLPRPFGSLHSTYALATEPTPAAERHWERCLVWESARPYYYLRTTPDNRFIIGGEDSPFRDEHRRDRVLARKAQRLEKRLEAMFPGERFQTACAWAGTFGESDDALPYIGSPDEVPLAYFSLGYGGNGVTFSVLAARIITDDVVGRPNRDADLFSFARSAD